MALITKMDLGSKDRPSIHDEIEATYFILTLPNGKILQIDTYGRENRDIPGKASQSIQFSPEAILKLKEILKDF